MKQIKLMMDHYDKGVLVGRAGDLVEVEDDVYEYINNSYASVRQEAAPQVEQMIELTKLVKGKKK